MEPHDTLNKQVSQGIDYQDYLNQVNNRNLVIWELHYGVKYPKTSDKKRHTVEQIADMYEFSNPNTVRVIISRMKKKIKGGEIK